MKSALQFLAILATSLLLACDKNTVFSNNEDFSDAKWYIKNSANFKVTIQNPNQAYKLYYNVRNHLNYPYYNLYVRRQVFDSTGNKLDEKLTDLQLSDDTTGKPFGSGLGDIYDHKILINKAYKFPKAGTYTFVLKQYMRQDPLPQILSFGITLAK
jgi:gliding motility-associated lipoprotein GldH